jgi:hypothetical protein
MQRDVLLLHEMIDAAEQARQLVAGRSVPDILPIGCAATR